MRPATVWAMIFVLALAVAVAIPVWIVRLAAIVLMVWALGTLGWLALRDRFRGGAPRQPARARRHR
ncbi:hypothetical protein [Compostimonas suwonensis]|uniref:Uncharacterized protein n=1 Tax=Compostimonas suwonensis TaxID=1048394 RepID=A0A2M9BCA6_9MICO|nr:hypothetical protein [Compostimonas suwonensis]PJJ55576.1 hypothetical protein CLV54_2923 [Compostimonas suwonensis]